MCVVYGFQLLVKVLFVFTVGLGFSWTFTVIIFNDPHGSTLFVSMYISFA
jgi:hypothetical protein